jgi:hypothetical protein
VKFEQGGRDIRYQIVLIGIMDKVIKLKRAIDVDIHVIIDIYDRRCSVNFVTTKCLATASYRGTLTSRLCSDEA